MTVSNQPVVHPYRWALIGALILCSLALIWYGFAIGVMLPDISEDLGLRPAQEGWLSSSFYLGQLVLTLPVTAWLARYEPLRTMGMVYAGTVLLLVAAAVTPWYWGEVVIRFALAFSFVALNPVRTLIIARWFRRDEVPRAMSVFNSGFGVIEAIAFWSSGLLLTALGGWRGLIWLLAGLAAASTAVWYMVARFAPPPAIAPPATEGNRGGSMARVLRHKQVWLLCLVATGGAMTWATYVTFWPTFAQDDLRLSEGATGVILGCSALAIIPGSLMAAWVVERVGSRRRFLIVATLSQVPLFGLWAVVESAVALLVIGLVQGLSWVYFPIMLSVPFDLEGFDAGDVALATGMFFVANAAALTAGPAVSGIAAEWVSLRAVLLVAALLPVLSTMGALFLVDSRRAAAPPGALLEPPGADLGGQPR